MLTATDHDLSDGDQVTLTTQSTLPAPLAARTVYYVANVAGNTFELSLAEAGTAINHTNNPNGIHRIIHASTDIIPGSGALARLDENAVPVVSYYVTPSCDNEGLLHMPTEETDAPIC